MCILHTVVPLEFVLAGLDLAGSPGGGSPDAPAGVARALVVPLGGGRFAELEGGPGGAVIRRIVSTVPTDYLDPRLQPGAPFRWN